MEFRTVITTHSGADGTPDNSLAYVHHALFTKTDALEVDIHKNSSDGTLYIAHDRKSGGAPVLSEVFALLAEHPTHPPMKINCDLKEPGLEEDVYHLALQYGLAGRLIYSGTVDAGALSDPDLSRDVEVYLNLEEYVDHLYFRYRDIPDFELEAAKQILRVCGDSGARTVNVFYQIVTRRFIETLAAHDVGVSVWTVSEGPDIEYFLTRNVRNLTTRNPATALAARNRLKETFPNGKLSPELF